MSEFSVQMDEPIRKFSNLNIRIVVVEQVDSIRDELVHFLNDQHQSKCTVSFRSAEEALDQLPLLRPDVVIVNIFLPGISGIDLIEKLRETCPETQCIICSANADVETIFAAFKAGAKGYLLDRTPPSKILEAILELYHGGCPMSREIARTLISSLDTGRFNTEEFTKREKEIVSLLAKGFRYKEVAEKLFISMDTVRTHIKHIYKKLNVNSRTDAILKLQNGNNFNAHTPF